MMNLTKNDRAYAHTTFYNMIHTIGVRVGEGGRKW